MVPAPMKPVVTPAEMAAIDAAAADSIDALIARAGYAVAREAVRLLGGTYGRRVAVLAGPGNNGADGRVAASVLRRRGAHVREFAVGEVDTIGPVDLVIDAAFGTGLRRAHQPPELTGTPQILAVDIVSGGDGLTGEIHGAAWRADRTVTFVARKPGLLFGDVAARSGEIIVADIGLGVGEPSLHVFEDADVARVVPPLPTDTHKWRRACLVVAGSPGMGGAARLASGAAMRAGAGYVRLSSPGQSRIALTSEPLEAVHMTFEGATPRDLHRFASVIVGPGLGAAARDVLPSFVDADQPLVIDGDGLTALAAIGLDRFATRAAATVLTPHDGEFATLTGAAPGADRVAAARRLAVASSCVVLLKGPTTVVAQPDGRAWLVVAGRPTLATAGTGDVLAGIIGGFLARGADPFDAAAAAAQVHGLAAGSQSGLVASDLVATMPTVLTQLGVL